MSPTVRSACLWMAVALAAADAATSPPAQAAHLRLRGDPAVRTLVAGDAADLDVGDIRVTADDITIEVHGRQEGTRGSLRLAARGTAVQPLRTTPSFDIIWFGATPPPAAVTAWTAGMAARDDGAWWQADAPLDPATDPPQLAWPTLTAALAWLLLMASAVTAAVLTLPPPALVRVGLWAIGGAALGAEAAWAHGGGGPTTGQLDAIAGRAAGPWDALAAIVHWHLHVPTAWTGSVSGALTVALVSGAAAAWARRNTDTAQRPSNAPLPLLATCAAVAAVWFWSA